MSPFQFKLEQSAADSLLKIYQIEEILQHVNKVAGYDWQVEIPKDLKG